MGCPCPLPSWPIKKAAPLPMMPRLLLPWVSGSNGCQVQMQPLPLLLLVPPSLLPMLLLLFLLPCGVHGWLLQLLLSLFLSCCGAATSDQHRCKCRALPWQTSVPVLGCTLLILGLSLVLVAMPQAQRATTVQLPPPRNGKRAKGLSCQHTPIQSTAEACVSNRCSITREGYYKSNSSCSTVASDLTTMYNIWKLA